MKLVKLLSKPLSSVAGIVGIPNAEDVVIPTNKEVVSKDKNQKSLLISDDRFTLLQLNHVKTYIIKEFSETAVVSLGDFDKKKTYVISNIISPSEIETFDPSEYKKGEFVFVYSEVKAEHPGEPPVIKKPMAGFSFTPQEYVSALNDYNKEMKEYTKKLETYKEAVKEFIETGDASKEEFGWLIEIISDTQYKVVADFSFETTKDAAQFGVYGKLPKDIATKVTEAIGGITENDSIKGLSIAKIIEKALGLVVEEESVGKIFPEE